MNEYDSNRIIDTVKKIGFEKTDNLEETDCYLLNTCHIRDKAKDKVYHEIGRVKKRLRLRKKPFVIEFIYNPLPPTRKGRCFFLISLFIDF